MIVIVEFFSKIQMIYKYFHELKHRDRYAYRDMKTWKIEIDYGGGDSGTVTILWINKTGYFYYSIDSPYRIEISRLENA